ncbi:hypothetical protein D3C87_1697940 [compost metagenome]
MLQAEKLLGVIVLEVGHIILCGQVFTEFVVGPGEQEFIAFPGAATHRQAGTVAGRP